MKNALSTTLAAAMLLGSAMFAWAGEGQGVIASIDPETRTIMLEDGSTWVADAAVSLDGLTAGDTINVVFTDGTTTLTEVTKVE